MTKGFPCFPTYLLPPLPPLLAKVFIAEELYNEGKDSKLGWGSANYGKTQRTRREARWTDDKASYYRSHLFLFCFYDKCVEKRTDGSLHGTGELLLHVDQSDL